MTSAEKIVAGILADADDAAAQLLAKGNEKAEEILANARQKAEAERKSAVIEADRRCETVRHTGDSGAALIERDAALKVRLELIEQTLAQAVERINNLPDAEYFAFLADVLQNSCETGGTMYLNEKDGKRDTSLLTVRLPKETVLSDTPVNIDGGFVLKNGDIEINASLSAMVREKHTDLVDRVNRILFL